MTSHPIALLVAVLFAVTIPFAAASPGSLGDQPGGSTLLQTTVNESVENASAAPGATLFGALGSEAAELDGEFERRSLAHAVGTATSTGASAASVAARLADVETRLDALEARRERLREAHENGTITDAEFRARMTVLAARARSLDRLGSRTAVYANRLPADALAHHDVTPDRVATLRDRAATMAAFERDLFEGSYGNRTLPEGGLDESFPGEAFDDTTWNATTPNATNGFVAGESDANETNPPLPEGDDATLNETDLNVTDA